MKMNDLLMDAMHLVELDIVTKEEIVNMGLDDLKELVDNHQ